MDLMIYSDDALDIIKLGEMDQRKTMDYFKEHAKDDKAQVKAIIGAYAAELIIAADEDDIKLNLSYDTIKNIPDALESLYQKQYKLGLKDQRNKELTVRALAAYINLLVINNFEDVSIDARRYPNNKENEARPDRWTGFLTLILDGQKKSDMLPYIWEGANTDKEVKNGFFIDIDPLVEGYKKLTGGKLTDEGLTDMTLTHEEEGPHLIVPDKEIKTKEPHLIL